MEQVILLSVNSYENKTIAGLFWYGCLGKGQSFSSLMELLLLIEAHLEELDALPENRTCRSFLNPRLAEMHLQNLPSISSNCHCGALAVFQLKILFRQNSSWQGLLTWVDGKQEQSFRSVLELVHLLDSALMEARIPVQNGHRSR